MDLTLYETGFTRKQEKWKGVLWNATQFSEDSKGKTLTTFQPYNEEMGGYDNFYSISLRDEEIGDFFEEIV